MRASGFAACMLALVALTCSSPERQLESGRRYMSINYSDTTRESFDRTDRAVTGVIVASTGDSIRFRIRTKDDALVAGVDITLHPATSRDAHIASTRVGMPKGTLPMMGTSVAFLEQVLRRARVVGGDSVTIPVMQVGAQASLEVLTLIKNGSDSVVLVGPDGNQAMGLHLAVDGQGRILGGVIPASNSVILSLDAAQ